MEFIEWVKSVLGIGTPSLPVATVVATGGTENIAPSVGVIGKITHAGAIETIEGVPKQEQPNLNQPVKRKYKFDINKIIEQRGKTKPSVVGFGRVIGARKKIGMPTQKPKPQNIPAGYKFPLGMPNKIVQRTNVSIPPQRFNITNQIQKLNKLSSFRRGR